MLVKATQQQFAVRQPCGTWLIVIRFANRDPLAGQRVELDYARITDAGLVHLKGLTKLDWLVLNSTQVTNTGVKKFQQALPNCKIRH